MRMTQSIWISMIARARAKSKKTKSERRAKRDKRIALDMEKDLRQSYDYAFNDTPFTNTEETPSRPTLVLTRENDAICFLKSIRNIII